MELIIISSPLPVAQEAEAINELFDAGMGVFHLRKPDWSYEQTAKLLTNINSKYHHQIALHHHHDLSDEFEIKRLHFTELKRKNTSKIHLANLKKMGFITSTSAHQISDLTDLVPFHYKFYGPVFDSISKKGYLSKVGKNFNLASHLINTKVIALGGIELSNLSIVTSMGFDGIAVLGTIWQKHGNDRITTFQKLQTACYDQS
ncbi:thiamine phosphate synthase [Belliella kenyensis]|uniref:Thiamine phosphate synthase n=1 Tax=Belliella kenyensis TaxID=1472724 RepID=A0ABV8EMX0_9BACT|nr:thiamine phosphate synthase [Belliella kenyensis]MCH7403394.1 thiamine phosphate synthase [Belliella kenyensis]MDN3601606.1 thiamine phosphate synthase [Belliella kenyensis]